MVGMLLAAVEQMRHPVFVVVGMRYLEMDKLVHLKDIHLLEARSADMPHQAVLTLWDIPVLDLDNLVFGSDIPEQVDIDRLDSDTVQSSADNQVVVDQQVDNRAVADRDEVALVEDIPLDRAVVATTFLRVKGQR